MHLKGGGTGKEPSTVLRVILAERVMYEVRYEEKMCSQQLVCSPCQIYLQYDNVK